MDESGPDPLVIRKLEFIGGMATVDGWRPAPELPEIAFAGRSNVGKSSLLNRLIRRKAFARVSRTPGRTSLPTVSSDPNIHPRRDARVTIRAAIHGS